MEISLGIEGPISYTKIPITGILSLNLTHESLQRRTNLALASNKRYIETQLKKNTIYTMYTKTHLNQKTNTTVVGPKESNSNIIIGTGFYSE